MLPETPAPLRCPNSMPKLSFRQRAMVRRALAPVEKDPSEMGGELNIVPFLDVVVNLIMFLLLTTATALAVVQSEVSMPTQGPARRPATLGLALTITPGGVIVTSADGKLDEGCQGTTTGAAITVPIRDGHYDWPALGACLSRIKDRWPVEEQVIIGADPQIEYEHFVAALDASRGSVDHTLFPDVLISAGVR